MSEESKRLVELAFPLQNVSEEFTSENLRKARKVQLICVDPPWHQACVQLPALLQRREAKDERLCQ